MGVKVLLNSKNKGRGYSRSIAMKRAKNDLVLSCDATNILKRDFLEKAISCFQSKNVAAVYGRIRSAYKNGVVNQWRRRHLFKEYSNFDPKPQKTNLLITYGIVVRKSHVMRVGNFDERLRHSEDGELGERLVRANYSLLWYPSIEVISIIRNSLSEVLERYWRWYAGRDERITTTEYLHAIKASIKPMAQTDLSNNEWCCVLISLLCPHYCFLKSVKRKFFLSKKSK
jgi:GT2 family glycosyltransferase